MDIECRLHYLEKRIELLRKELISSSLNTKKSLNISQKLDELIVKYLKLKKKQK